jgi:hypothetical protein
MGMQLNQEYVLPEEKEADQWSGAGRGDHPIYEVKNEYGKTMSISILQLYFGETWEPAMDRLIHQFDGYLMRIHYQGSFLKVYRKLLGNPQQLQPNLNLVKP